MRTLLLADDSITTQRVIALTFADDQFRVVTVSDGQQAIDKMAAQPPDIVLAGTTLPRTNGYELAQFMRSHPALAKVPVLLLTGAFESVDEAQLKASGANGVLEKPLEPTAVISRVRELLGLKDTRPALPAGRLVTSVDGPSDRNKRMPSRPATAAPERRAPERQAPVSSWDELRQESGLEPDQRSVEGGSHGGGREDYLDTLDAAFDSLDQHLAGRHPDAHQQRNPSPPLGQAGGAADPRSPGRTPSQRPEGSGANSVYEVDTEWFLNDPKAVDLESRHEIVTDAHAAVLPRAEAPAGHGIFEVDDEWFAEDEKAREHRRSEQKQLAAEMGIHDVELPPAEPRPVTAAPAAGLDFDFALDDLPPAPAKQGPAHDSPFAPESPGPTAIPKPAPAAVVPAPVAAEPPMPVSIAPLPSSTAAAHTRVADDFAALLAFEQGEPPPAAEPPVAPAPAVLAAPEITEAMLDQLASRVADRINSGTFAADLREAMSTTLRDTVRSVVSETSERLVRDEIARVKARAERDTP